ncbi:MAG: hypothetical protein AB7F22_28925 [Reyranella sp.]|uniref:hypothetical protein n=1 Tax=Reyranella sp. TaxID=1929291 RepID=UPI003D12F211
MIGHRVRLILWDEIDGSSAKRLITGTLHRLDQAGAVIWRENHLPEGQGNTFIPMHRIHEIVDLGRAS